MKYQQYPKKYYYVEYLEKSWQPFLHHDINISEVYWTESGFINRSEYRKDFNDAYYVYIGTYPPGNRADCCFQVSEDDLFVLIEDAKEYAKEKLDKMYIQRCQSLLGEYKEAQIKLNLLFKKEG